MPVTAPYDPSARVPLEPHRADPVPPPSRYDLPPPPLPVNYLPHVEAARRAAWLAVGIVAAGVAALILILFGLHLLLLTFR